MEGDLGIGATRNAAQFTAMSIRPHRRSRGASQLRYECVKVWVASLLLIIHAGLVARIGWIASPNKTEVAHMAATVYFAKTLHFDVFHVNPPLTRVIGSVPIMLCDPRCNWNAYSPLPQDRSEWELGKGFIAANSSETTRRCFVLARWSLIPILVLGGYAGYRLSRDIHGQAAGFVFLALWCFSPLLMAWGATICPDAAAAAMGLVAIYSFHQWLRRPTWFRTTIAGGCLGLLPLTKSTWILAFAIWPFVWLLWTMVPRKRPETRFHKSSSGQMAVMLLCGIYILNMGYLFDGSLRPLGQYSFISKLFCGTDATAPTANRFSGTWLGAMPVPLPAEFVQGIDTQRLDFERGIPSYLRGEWADHGWWYYYLYALLIKEPLATWCLAALAIGVTIVERGCSKSWHNEVLVLVPFAVIFVVVSSQDGFSAHPRYVIPVLPFLFVWISKVGRVFQTRPFTKARLALAAVIAFLLVWSVASSVAIYPHSLSYFNELTFVMPTSADAMYPTSTEAAQNRMLSRIIGAGPRSGPRHLLDSNIDWGQDLFHLEQWCGSHPKARPIKVAYFGSYPLDKTEIESDGHPPSGPDAMHPGMKCGPLAGWHAVSVNEIYGRSRQYRYFLNFEPVAMAGYSICIYHITARDANRVRREMGLSELNEDECRPGDTSP